MIAWKLAILSSLFLGSWAILPKIGLAESIAQEIISQRPPEPPQTPLPPNRTTPGGGLNPTDSSCNEVGETLRALIPVENPVRTTEAHPTFLFFSPFGAGQIDYGEFSLLPWPGEEQRHYSTRFTLPDSPGIVSITLPGLPEYALKEDQPYRWYFQIHCKDNPDAQPDLTLDGAVQRVAPTSVQSPQIQSPSPEIWYDTLALVAKRLQESPQDPQLQEHWRSLLQSIQADDLTTMTFSGAVLPLEE